MQSLDLFADGDDFSWETIETNRNTYYQKQLANQVINRANELISLLTTSLGLHLNTGQGFHLDTSQMMMSLETKSIQSLSTAFTKPIGNARVQLPENLSSHLGNHQSISIRVRLSFTAETHLATDLFFQSMIEPLASFGNSKAISNTNLSRSVSFSILDHNHTALSVQATPNNSIEIIIPRDPNLVIPSMTLQNVSFMNSTPHQLIFQLHYLNVAAPLPVSVHWEMQPLNTSLAYLLVFRFDQVPYLNSSIKQIDGWTLLCPFSKFVWPATSFLSVPLTIDLSNESLYHYFIDNQRTSGHQAVIFGLRELNSTESSQACSGSSANDLPVTNKRFDFTSNYQWRMYTSGCYYLDGNNQWKADGLTVSRQLSFLVG